MQSISIHYTKKAQRIYIGLISTLSLGVASLNYFLNDNLIAAIITSIGGLSIIIFCGIVSYKKPLMILTKDSLKIAAKGENDIFSWEDIAAYHTTEKELIVTTKEKTVKLTLWGLDKSPEEIVRLLSMYKNRR
jgi:hypothetical protein